MPRFFSTHRASLVLVVLLMWAGIGSAWAQNAANTERRLQQTREQLRQTAAERRDAEQALQAANAQLRQADANVARSSRQLAEVEQALSKQEEQLAQARQQGASLQAAIQAQRGKLASLLRDSQRQGNHSALKLLLSQDQLADSQRVLAYQRYLQQQRIELLDKINADLAQIKALELQAGQLQSRLLEQREQHRLLTSQLARERQSQRQAVARLNAQHAEKKSRETALARDVRSLETVLANLRSQAARAASAQRQQASRNSASAATRSSGSRAQSARASQPAASSVRVGGGAWPLSGTLVTRFGARQSDGRPASGILIEAAAGAPVTAVAAGKVVYSDWMTGYGMILIIDHGDGYMSLYAHNESLLRDVGSRVARGEQIARVGNSGGQGRNALYFELRRNGRPVDPATWLRR